MGKKNSQPKKGGDDRPYIVMSKHCHLCHDQEKVNKMYGFEKDFIPLFIENKKDRVIIDEMQKRGIQIEGTPTFVCHDFSCSDAGARGPKLLVPFLQKARKNYKYVPGPSPASASSSSRSRWLLPILFILVFAIVGIALIFQFLI